jgi:hypothetical protein
MRRPSSTTIPAATLKSGSWLAARGICRHRDAARLYRHRVELGARCVGLASVRCAPGGLGRRATVPAWFHRKPTWARERDGILDRHAETDAVPRRTPFWEAPTPDLADAREPRRSVGQHGTCQRWAEVPDIT